MHIDETPCCGLNFLDGLEEKPSKIILNVCEDRWPFSRISGLADGDCPPFYAFADVTEYGNAEKLVKFIKKNDLGEVIQTKSKNNPNSGNYIRTYVWTVAIKNLRSWYIANAIK